MSVNSGPRTIPARRADRCPVAGQTCRYPDGQIHVGDAIKAAEGIGWVHAEDVVPALPGLAPRTPQNDMRELAIAAEADRLLNEYHNHRDVDRDRRGSMLPTGNYTVRPADEKMASVLSIGPAEFGSFPRGTRKVAVHGSFSVLVDGLSEHRSWYGFAIVKPGGHVSVYKKAAAILNTRPADLRPEDVHLQTKIRLALKSVRLLIEAGEAEIMAYGKAYASQSGKCYRCDRALTDETSISLGIGPECRKRQAAEIAGLKPR